MGEEAGLPRSLQLQGVKTIVQGALPHEMRTIPVKQTQSLRRRVFVFGVIAEAVHLQRWTS
mgnify:CR=1 FL=1|tara:strand:- start:320 stop:502 length:183 start_codon:yes stop_codon:yes gene_type:complete